MQIVADATGTETQPAIRFFRQRDKLFNILRDHPRMHQHQITHAMRDDGHWRKVAINVVGEVTVHQRIDHKIRRCVQQCVAIGRGLGDQIGGDDAGGAITVVDDKILPHLRGDLTRSRTRNQVLRAAGGEPDNQPDRPCRISICRKQRAC